MFSVSLFLVIDNFRSFKFQKLRQCIGVILVSSNKNEGFDKIAFSIYVLKLLAYPRIPDEEALQQNICNLTASLDKECVLQFNCNPAVDLFSIMKGILAFMQSCSKNKIVNV